MTQGFLPFSLDFLREKGDMSMNRESVRRMSGAKAVGYLLLTGFGAGFANGLLGAGGGIVVIFSLGAFLLGQGYGRQDLYANALCVMLPITAVSCVRYAMAGHLVTEGFGIYALPAIIGGVLGAILLGRLKASLLKKLFGALVVYSGILLIIR